MSPLISIETMGKAYSKLIDDVLNGHYPLPRSRKSILPIDLGMFSWRDFIPPALKQVLRTVLFWRKTRQNTI